MKRLERTSPRYAGVAQEAIGQFVRYIKEHAVNMHGFMLIKGGKVFAEGYWSPFTSNTPHRMYSISKSFTSIAIGLLEEERKLSLMKPISCFFSDKLPEQIHPYNKEMTVRDLLCMTSAHKTTTYKGYSGDWVESFFHKEPTHHPGTIFSYDTSASHTLAALSERLSGTSLLAYLKKKVLDRLEFSEGTRWLTDPYGICQGGTGLICSMEDLAKFAVLLLNRGNYEGEQLLPEQYVAEATAKQVDTGFSSVLNERQGYGYQFWRSRHNGFTMYGMGGQLAVCLPEHEFIMITTADTQGDATGLPSIYEALWEFIYPELERTKRPPIQSNIASENSYYYQDSHELLQGNTEYQTLLPYCGKYYRMRKNPMGLQSVCLSFVAKEGTLWFENEEGSYILSFGFREVREQKFPGTKMDCLASATVFKNTIHIQVKLLGDNFAGADIGLGFTEAGVTVFMKKAAENFLLNYEGVAAGEAIS